MHKCMLGQTERVYVIRTMSVQPIYCGTGDDCVAICGTFSAVVAANKDEKSVTVLGLLQYLLVQPGEPVQAYGPDVSDLGRARLVSLEVTDKVAVGTHIERFGRDVNDSDEFVKVCAGLIQGYDSQPIDV